MMMIKFIHDNDQPPCWFDSLLELHNNYVADVPKISRYKYYKWRKAYVFDALKGLRYGQSFCNRFAINDRVLSRLTHTKNADRHIRQYYIK